MDYLYKNDKDELICLNFPIGTAPSSTVIDDVEYERDLMAELSGKQFCLKGSGWPGQDSKRKEQMTRKNSNAGKKMKDTWGDSIKLQPNYKGEVTETWKEAASLAEKDKE